MLILKYTRTVILSAFLLAHLGLQAQNGIERPKLVVGIVIDQMRQEYLLRFYDKFGDAGFKRLMNQGFMLRNAHYNYVPTYTGPGHASVFTGTTPNTHGIIANNWYSRAYGRKINCVEDTAARVVGGHESFGAYSPRNLQVNTITDELKIFTQNNAKVIGMSLKNRGAILPAGHKPDGAYWFDEKTYNFVTSTYYGTDLPNWVKTFNEKKYVDEFLRGKWETSFPISEYTEAGPDDTPYELVWKGREQPTFPYDLKKLIKKNKPVDVFKHSPFGDHLLTSLAKQAIDNEALGADEVTDFLTVSYSSTDRIGHKYGPNSVEIEDAFIKLDGNIAELLTYLDQKVGEGEYLVFLTTDHGVADVPRYLNDNKIPTWYIIGKTMQKQVHQFMVDNYGPGNWLLDATNEQVYLDHSTITQRGLQLREVREKLADYLQAQKGISKAYPAHQLGAESLSSKAVNALIKGYHEDRSGDILLILEPGWIPDEWYYFKYGTRHGSHYTYDTHVPVLFYGWNIRKGSSVRYHPVIDIAPTLSMLLNIRLPNAATGQPIEELFEE